MTTTIVLPGSSPNIEFRDGVDYTIRHGVLTVCTQTETRHYAPGRWLEVREES